MYDFRLFINYSQIPGALDLFAFGIALAKFVGSRSFVMIERRWLLSIVILSLASAVLIWLVVFPADRSTPWVGAIDYLQEDRLRSGVRFNSAARMHVRP